MIYDELREQVHIETDYIGIGAWLEGKPVGAIVMDMDDDGNLTLLSIWTDQSYRRQGVATALFGKVLDVATQLYDWDEYQYGDDIMVNTMYCLEDRYRLPLEEWLKKIDFTDFCLLKDENDDRPAIRSATAEVHMFRVFG